jgi:hypothetical protein
VTNKVAVFTTTWKGERDFFRLVIKPVWDCLLFIHCCEFEADWPSYTIMVDLYLVRLKALHVKGQVCLHGIIVDT